MGVAAILAKWPKQSKEYTIWNVSLNSQVISEKNLFRCVCDSPKEWVALDEKVTGQLDIWYFYKTIVSLG